MSEVLTFDKFSPAIHGAEGIYQIGADAEHAGVAVEMAEAFGHELSPAADADNLGGLIHEVGPEKELQKNIQHVIDVLTPLGDPVEIARDWAERSGFLVPVERMYVSGEETSANIDLVIIKGAVRNWMMRRTDRLVDLAKTRKVDVALLAGGTRQVGTGEGPDVEEGMNEADYLKYVVAPILGEAGVNTEVLRVNSDKGDEIMQEMVRKSQDLIPLWRSHVSVIANAGPWVQDGGQYLRAAKEASPKFDKQANQLEVVSDSFLLGTATEPAATHQNPLSALGQIARNLQEFTRHIA